MNRKNFTVYPYMFPVPTWMIGTYNEDDSVDVMMMGWGGIVAYNMVALNLYEGHKTVQNLRQRQAFTLSIPGVDTLKESDYFGKVSANNVPDKFIRTGLHAQKSLYVDAPVIMEYPLALECKVAAFENEPYGLRVLGEIINVTAAENVLDHHGQIDAGKLHAFAADWKTRYYALGEEPLRKR